MKFWDYFTENSEIHLFEGMGKNTQLHLFFGYIPHEFYSLDLGDLQFFEQTLHEQYLVERLVRSGVNRERIKWAGYLESELVLYDRLTKKISGLSYPEKANFSLAPWILI
jgi:hypothetical protein